jgi:hypothetical protein
VRRRKAEDDPDVLPDRLTRYDAADWPDAECPVCAFYAALSGWSAAHPDAPMTMLDEWPDDPWSCASKNI